jgi:K+-transporting ATPase ATPase A chain
MLADWLQIAIVLAIILLLVRPMGSYMYAVFTGKRTFLDRVLDPVDRVIYRIAGIDPTVQQTWWPYARAMLVTNAVMFLILLVILLTQQYLPLNPDGMGAIDPFLAFNTAASFITNTNWQSYGGEYTLSYFSQLFAIIFPMFTSAATGLACGIAFIRGLGGSVTLGNFYSDLVRSVTRILLPISFVAAVAFVALGVPATFEGAATATTLNGPLAATSAPADSPTDISQGTQTIARGVVAPLTSIKHLGTNGGGWFNVNSAHPFENPSAMSNVLENVLMALIPTALIYTLGLMLLRKRQAWTFFWVMAGFFAVFLVVAYIGEAVVNNPILTGAGLDPSQGSMEGKEVRFGQALTALFVTSTTAFTTGTVDAMHDSLTPLASITPLSQMFLNMIFGGKGVGFINLIIYAIIGIFLTGLMVGRTPEFLGKKIEVREVKLASLAFLVHPLLILGTMAITLALQIDLTSIPNPSFHGFSEVMYAYASGAANNGSAFAGLNANTPWFNTSLGVVIIVGRYLSILFMLALAGSLAAKRTTPMTLGTMRTDTPLFAGVLSGTILVVGALTFFAVLALGPIAEHFAMVSGKVF